MKKILAGPGKIEWTCPELGAATHKIHRARRGWAERSRSEDGTPVTARRPRHRANRARDRKCFARSDFQYLITEAHRGQGTQNDQNSK